ncbi:hypothetical protein AQJ43_00805 [Streptomyces avermitilis]|uniref:Uncharacterized protein n=2 Tax=Streptomyces avermitilis TaxID=33903 RepID=Q82J26_STRAW|nr:hypothetical protein [Streptomyces avermitilis]MYS98556.1 hypothetical protein [Streptomyces sp. SID5469]KUN56187.1 hypothetical protein AQJ43_00805 [Streptomyces avermitilis]OOV33088.1 hypothetical protein SM007_10010 [Streptomyces avermitilis]BAC70667.1 hypothetical protein SAVERM_2956 [Streptomyces avermitilis MA-4680 = NBRC 14893]GDY62828.1 hypothetical protein SAV14893_022210 [Streptomyces avermitilis]
MKSEDTPFVGGPLDGRVLPILLGPTGHPPKTYRVPVPDAAGGPPTVLVYRREQAAQSKRLGLHKGWKYVYDPEGDSGGGRIRWPWSKPAPTPATQPDGTPDSAPDRKPDATPDGKPDAADG